MSVLKIGAVSYLNTKPLVEGLAALDPNVQIEFDLPSRLASRFSDGQFDAALIPVVEAITNPDCTIVSDACIACHGPVWSVKLMSRLPVNKIQTLALDEGSRTSCALTRVILAHKFGVRPKLRPLRIDEDWREADSDAVLIIGDRAMKAEDERFPVAWDLGQTWMQWTNHPFVFAVWAARPESDVNRLDQILSTARDQGIAKLDAIAADQADNYGLGEDECLTYLRDYLHFRLGEQEKLGIELFFDYAAEISLIPDSLRLQFYDCQTAR